MSSSMNSLEWRRNKVQELSSQGHSQPEIARILQISQPTVNRDLVYLRKQAQENLQRHIQETLPHEYQKCMVGINQVLKIGWDIVNNDSTNNNIRLQALSLINDCNKYKMDLTTNGIVITDAIKFVQQNSKEKLKSPEKKEKYNNNKESKEPNYNEDKEQQEEDQEKGIREISESEAKATTNQVF
ncbi:MAG TPA: helix-turn-helix domain-containing protein [Nitrososphaeraceae archaeon]